MGYDLEHDPEIFVFTHARAFSTHPEFELVGGVDASSERRTLFSEKYGKPSFEVLGKALEALQPNVVVIAAPTNMHAQLVGTTLDCQQVKAILCEKPLAYSIKEAKGLVEACDKAGIALFVNYMRRVDAGVVVKQMLRDGGI